MYHHYGKLKLYLQNNNKYFRKSCYAYLKDYLEEGNRKG